MRLVQGLDEKWLSKDRQEAMASHVRRLSGRQHSWRAGWDVSHCNGCGGIVGRDCYNPQECELIAQDMQYHAAAESAREAVDMEVRYELDLLRQYEKDTRSELAALRKIAESARFTSKLLKEHYISGHAPAQLAEALAEYDALRGETK